MPKDKKQFALEAIKPYFKDPSLCAVKGRSCKYLTEDGRKCVLGKYMLDPGRFPEGDALSIFSKMKQSEVLTPEAVDILSVDEWGRLQNIHDGIATGKDEEILRNRVYSLGLFTWEELIAE